MKPIDCKTAFAARTAAQGVFEARLVAFGALKEFRPCERLLHEFVDGKLHRLEHEYWRRADELSRATKIASPQPNPKRGKKGRKR